MNEDKSQLRCPDSSEIAACLEVLHISNEARIEGESVKLKAALELSLDKNLFLNEQDLSGFRMRLALAWKTPLDRLRSLSMMCQEILLELVEDQSVGCIAFTPKFNALTKLFSRAVQLSGEIHNSLSGGYSEGALSRWRAMHETCVILSILSSSDCSVSERFLDFRLVLDYRAAKFFNDFSGAGEAEKISILDMSHAEAKYLEVLAKYEQGFDKENGWAAPLITEKGKITFFKLEALSGYDPLRVQYKIATQYVHTGADSLGNRLGLSLSKKNILLTGPSNEGLAQPLIYCGLSLVAALSSLVHEYPGRQRDVFEATAWKWFSSLQDEAMEALGALAASGHPEQ